eukprot:Sspe_Gene.62708::Locus_35401_Transcript_1_1_Confidence_1.000_Length_3474::g.62708::m.62708
MAFALLLAVKGTGAYCTVAASQSIYPLAGVSPSKAVGVPLSCIFDESIEGHAVRATEGKQYRGPIAMKRPSPDDPAAQINRVHVVVDGLLGSPTVLILIAEGENDENHLMLSGKELENKASVPSSIISLLDTSWPIKERITYLSSYPETPSCRHVHRSLLLFPSNGDLLILYANAGLLSLIGKRLAEIINTSFYSVLEGYANHRTSKKLVPSVKEAVADGNPCAFSMTLSKSRVDKLLVALVPIKHDNFTVYMCNVTSVRAISDPPDFVVPLTTSELLEFTLQSHGTAMDRHRTSDMSGQKVGQQPSDVSRRMTRMRSPHNVALTDVEISQYERFFNTFDKDGSGTIDMEELRDIMQCLGVWLTDEELLELQNTVDTNKSGEVEFGEFLILMKQYKESCRYKVLQKSPVTQKHLLEACKSKRLLPDDPWKWIWDVIMALVTLYYTIIILYKNTRPVPQTLGKTVVEGVLTCFLLADVVLHFNLAQVDENVMFIEDVRAIMRGYMRTWFLLDITAALPFDLVAYSVGFHQAGSILGHLRLLRLIRIPTLFPTSMRGTMSPSYVRFHFHYVPLIHGLFWWIVMIHVMSCIWLILDSDDGYITAMYWVLYTLTSVGYGDIDIDSDEKRIYASLLFIVGLVVNGVLVGKLTVIIQKGGVKEERTERMRQTLAVMEHFGVPEVLKEEILAYQHHLLRNSMSSSFTQVLAGLPQVLRDNLGLFIRIKLISLVPLFSKAPQECQVALASAMQTFQTSPEELIVVVGDPCDEMYFIAHGFVEVISKNGDHIGTIKKGSNFGEEALLGQQKREHSVKALTYCDLFVLGKVDVIDIMNRFPAFRSTIEEERQRRLRDLEYQWKGTPPVTASRSFRNPLKVQRSGIELKTQNIFGSMSSLGSRQLARGKPASLQRKVDFDRRLNIDGECDELERDETRSVASSVLNLGREYARKLSRESTKPGSVGTARQKSAGRIPSRGRLRIRKGMRKTRGVKMDSIHAAIREEGQNLIPAIQQIVKSECERAAYKILAKLDDAEQTVGLDQSLHKRRLRGGGLLGQSTRFGGSVDVPDVPRMSRKSIMCTNEMDKRIDQAIQQREKQKEREHGEALSIPDSHTEHETTADSEVEASFPMFSSSWHM